jgi:hypothetical protein
MHVKKIVSGCPGGNAILNLTFEILNFTTGSSRLYWFPGLRLSRPLPMFRSRCSRVAPIEIYDSLQSGSSTWLPGFPASWLSHFYSDLNEFTGFVRAAFTDSKLTVSHAMTSAATNAIAKIVQSMVMWYAKRVSH